jgi:hypothetical protein
MKDPEQLAKGLAKELESRGRSQGIGEAMWLVQLMSAEIQERRTKLYSEYKDPKLEPGWHAIQGSILLLQQVFDRLVRLRDHPEDGRSAVLKP